MYKVTIKLPGDCKKIAIVANRNKFLSPAFATLHDMDINDIRVVYSDEKEKKKQLENDGFLLLEFTSSNNLKLYVLDEPKKEVSKRKAKEAKKRK